ncbi:hypothetical protein [Pseudoxanthomonas dokdonensis]|uniref:Peptide methionine sulfoxide reductase n=1 Tax=Pseudoxanthomonas dokdonensis TaxID=344882 RepID=A0A0R0CS76_9GAMM|nr:hypothetical protein [Pseudoxanthomonas dokdonensis]KRG67624.1 hypothetical protein ABB29_15380 [Pseudoxanthomonas dokdonensis]
MAEAGADDAAGGQIDLAALIARVPLGYREVLYQGRRYGLSRTDFNAGNSSKIYAEALDGGDHVSLNYYRLGQRQWLRPCEMSDAKVVDFLIHHQPIN